MAGPEAAAGGSAPPIPIVRIAPEIPVIFADGVSTQSYAFGVVKMYLSRFDPDPTAAAPVKETTILQLVMPTENFVRTVMFLEHRLKQMVRDGAITQALIDESRKYWLDNPNAGRPNA